MTWEDYNKNFNPSKNYIEMYHWERVDVECPKCKEKIFKRTDIILTSYPPQFQYECKNCGWTGYSQK